MEQEKITDCEKTVLRGKIKNTGNRKGTQVVQLYVKNPRAWKARPARELRDFQKIILEAGEEKEFVFSISRELFELYDERVDERTVPQGMYGLELGFSVQDIRAAQKIEVTPVFPVPKQIQGWDKTERLLETKAGEQIFEELYRKITEKAGGIFAQRLKEEKNVREMLLSQPIRIVHLMIWNEMTDSELIAILEKVNQELYHDYREKMRSLEKNETIEEMKSFRRQEKITDRKGRKTVGRQMKWFRDAKFGMFIHWGVYSMLGKGEWVLMNEHLDVRKYETLKDDFLAEFDAEQWAKNAKAAG